MRFTTSYNPTISFAVVLACVLLAIACRKDNNPVVISEKKQQRFQLPQGNSAFDTKIVDYYNRYNSYILYKFSDIDFNYAFSYNLADPPNGNITPRTGPVLIRCGDSIAIQSALDFMEQYWFSFYPEDFKKRCLPSKILLAGLIYNTTWNATAKIYDTPRVNPVTIPIEGADHITLPKIDTAFNSYSLSNKLLLKSQLNRTFLKHLMYPSISTMPPLVPLPDQFHKISDYTLGVLTNANKYKYGFLTVYAGNRSPDPMTDMVNYLDTICTKPKAALDAWMLNPNVDSLGFTRRKYDLLINYFKNNYNVDIQAIGNKQD
ncbi:MAG: hypothetical protein J7578_12280 [Chitinophagaceae bacterium]|nr:hypothetical protein [Chitinophagaceae bacterium]